MAIYREDDDLDLERELEETDRSLDMMANEMKAMDGRRNHLRKAIAKRQLDPLVARALDLAQNLGHVLGANEALSRKIEHLSKRINIRDEEIERTEDRDDWKQRAETAEAKIARRRRR
jgi:seryl-tRNA synthetase